jgi:predicted nucleotidyltransferase
MQIVVLWRMRTGLLAVPIVLALALAGCGSSSSTSPTTTVTIGAGVQGGAKTAKPAPGSADVVATVGGVAITKAAYEHWLAVTAALSGPDGHGASASSQATKDKALGFLITEQWVLGEAAARGITVSEADVKQRLEAVERKQFKHSGELQKYLSKAHETAADLQQRARLELLESQIAQQVTAPEHTTAERQAALNKLQDEFEKRWRARTSCAAGYAMEDCS